MGDYVCAICGKHYKYVKERAMCEQNCIQQLTSHYSRFKADNVILVNLYNQYFQLFNELQEKTELIDSLTNEFVNKYGTYFTTDDIKSVLYKFTFHDLENVIVPKSIKSYEKMSERVLNQRIIKYNELIDMINEVIMEYSFDNNITNVDSDNVTLDKPDTINKDTTNVTNNTTKSVVTHIRIKGVKD